LFGAKRLFDETKVAGDVNRSLPAFLRLPSKTVRIGLASAPAFLIMAAAAAVSFLSVLQFRESYRAPFTGARAAAAAPA
jgi:hypothetical protein